MPIEHEAQCIEQTAFPHFGNHIGSVLLPGPRESVGQPSCLSHRLPPYIAIGVVSLDNLASFREALYGDVL